MAIFVDETTRVVVQGLTGSQGRFYGLRNRAYGTQVVAGTVATSAAVELSGSGNERFARQVAQGVADLEGVTLEAFSLEGPVVRVTVSDEAGSVLLGRLAPSWYEVERSAEATAVTGR